MGRLFWKFFLVVWLAQLAAVFATGTVFWLERRDREAARTGPPGLVPPPEAGMPRPFLPRPPPGPMNGGPPPAPGGPPPPLPGLHVLAGLVASVLSAAGIAWYVAGPVRRLKTAFVAAAEGDLAVRVSPHMGRRRDELADLGRGFDRMIERLRGLVEAQNRLLHDVSHELRSPIARLQAAVGLVRQQPARLDEIAARIEHEGERMSELVGELLTLSRAEADARGAREQTGLAELLADIAEDARLEAEPRGLRVNLAAEDLLLRTNAMLLRRAVENVVRNALRYAPAGSAVRIEGGATGDGRCRIAVLDRGPGVPAVELEAIFEPFHRLLGGPPEGSGLGLAIARRAIQALGGSISARNGADGGLVVEIELPPAD